MTIHLCTLYGAPIDVDFAGHELPIIIGRGKQADVSIEDRWVSRVHCQLDAVDDRLFVRDLESKYGTYVNESGVTCAEVLPGDRIEIGLTTILVETQDVNTHGEMEADDAGSVH